MVGIIYGSLCALAQRDIKKLVAYSSVAHLGFCMLGLFALNAAGITGGVLQMINHGLSTGGLFLLVGMIYDRYHTRQLDDLGGLAARLPLLAVHAWCSSRCPASACRGSTASSARCCRWPACSQRIRLYAVLGATGVVLGAWYLLTMLQHAFFGPLREPASRRRTDSRHEPARDAGDRADLRAVPVDRRACRSRCSTSIRPDVDAVVALYEQTATAQPQRSRSDAARSHVNRHSDSNPAIRSHETSAVPEAIEQITRPRRCIVPEIILLATVCVMFLVGPFLVSDAGEAPPGCGIGGACCR